jgi:hypothetical protein
LYVTRKEQRFVGSIEICLLSAMNSVYAKSAIQLKIKVKKNEKSFQQQIKIPMTE